MGLIVSEPNNWIKNTHLLYGDEDRHMNKLSVVYFAGEEDVASFNQSFKFPEADKLEESIVDYLTHLFTEQTSAAQELNPKIDTVGFLAIHESLYMSAKIVEALADLPPFFNLAPSVAIIADDNEWVDLFTERKGLVDETVITDFELSNIINGEDLVLRYDADGNLIEGDE
jgi:hypothetical protein